MNALEIGELRREAIYIKAQVKLLDANIRLMGINQ